MATRVRVKVELNSEGIRNLLCSGAIGSAVEGAAHAVADIAGDGYEVGDGRIMGGNSNPVYQGRVGYSVYTATQEAREDNAINHTLYRAVQLCRS